MDRDELMRLAKRVPWGMGGREALVPLAPVNDPFMSGTPGDHAKALWFRGLWDEMGYPPGTHVRSIHYHIATKLSYTYEKHDGTPYLHDKASYAYMQMAAKAARHLGLVIGLIEDKKSDPPIEYAKQRDEMFDGTREPGFALEGVEGTWEMPTLQIGEPATFGLEVEAYGYDYHHSDQPVLVEVWIEKKMAMSHIGRVCREHNVNLQWGEGIFGIEVFRKFVERVRQWGKPARLLYLADRDPAGWQMPVSCARHIEFVLHKAEEYDLDIRVEVVAVTFEQVEGLDPLTPDGLPRKYIEEEPGSAAHTRRLNWERRLGAGSTELNAIDDDAIAEIIERRVQEYRDEELEDEVVAAGREAQAKVEEALEAATEQFSDELEELRGRQQEVLDRYHALIEALAAQIAGELEPIARRSREIRRQIEASVEAQALELPDYPEADVEDPSPDEDYLFDSYRDYLEQMYYYRSHQGREDEWDAIADALEA